MVARIPPVCSLPSPHPTRSLATSFPWTATDCGFGREGMSRRHALYKMASLVPGTTLIRREPRLPECPCKLADPRFSLVPSA